MKKYQRTSEFDEWVDGASEETVENMIKIMKKRKLIYTLIWVVGAIITAVCASVGAAIEFPLLILMGVPMGLVLFCENNLVILKTRGNKKNNAFSVWFHLILGAILAPLIVVLLASKISSLGSKIIGF